MLMGQEQKNLVLDRSMYSFVQNSRWRNGFQVHHDQTEGQFEKFNSHEPNDANDDESVMGPMPCLHTPTFVARSNI
jgi:hypothetical protein